MGIFNQENLEKLIQDPEVQLKQLRHVLCALVYQNGGRVRITPESMEKSYGGLFGMIDPVTREVVYILEPYDNEGDKNAESENRDNR